MVWGGRREEGSGWGAPRPAALGSPRDRRWHHESGQPDNATQEPAHRPRRAYSAGIPDPELLIRPGGEERISNFLLWQCAYSEFYFTDVLWPDFTTEELDKAIAEYHRRDRRFGAVK